MNWNPTIPNLNCPRHETDALYSQSKYQKYMAIDIHQSQLSPEISQACQCVMCGLSVSSNIWLFQELGLPLKPELRLKLAPASD